MDLRLEPDKCRNDQEDSEDDGDPPGAGQQGGGCFGELSMNAGPDDGLKSGGASKSQRRHVAEPARNDCEVRHQ
jgi:hypothetical protein